MLTSFALEMLSCFRQVLLPAHVHPACDAVLPADLDVESLRADPRAANIRLHAGRLDGRDYQLLLQPDRETGVLVASTASRPIHQGQGLSCTLSL